MPHAHPRRVGWCAARLGTLGNSHHTVEASQRGSSVDHHAMIELTREIEAMREIRRQATRKDRRKQQQASKRRRKQGNRQEQAEQDAMSDQQRDEAQTFKHRDER